MSGKLYLCATPIGNLEDITLRVLRTLKEVDLIAAEDTRNSIKLLNHFEIKTPMTSYHEYNKIEKAYTLIEKMQNGMNIALITDAGTPGISEHALLHLHYQDFLPDGLLLKHFFRWTKKSAKKFWKSLSMRPGRSFCMRLRINWSGHCVI